MATGAGKSLCLFLVPLAIGDPAMGIMISPLTALMVCLQSTKNGLMHVCVGIAAARANFADATPGRYRFGAFLDINRVGNAER